MKSFNNGSHFRATLVETGRDLSLQRNLSLHQSDQKVFPIISLFLSISLFLISSCTKPEWNNPFGKDCPPDSWSPTNFLATQEGNTVKLTWNQDVKLISGFKLVKKVENLSENDPAKPVERYYSIR